MFNNDYIKTFNNNNIYDLKNCNDNKKIVKITINIIENAIIKLPNNLINLKSLFCINNSLYILPQNLNNLLELYISNTFVNYLPYELTNLQKIYCHNTNISIIPNTYTKLEELYCNNTLIEYFPETLIKLKVFICDNKKFNYIPDNLINLSVINIQNNIYLSKKLINLCIINGVYSNKYKKIKNGFSKFIYRFRIYKVFKNMWEKYENMIKNKYHYNNISYDQIMNM